MRPILLSLALAGLAAGAGAQQMTEAKQVDPSFVPPPVPPLAPVVDPATLSDPEIVAGQKVFAANCAHCHGDGRGMTGTAALANKYRDTDVPALIEERTDLTPELVTFFVRGGAGAMAPYRKTEISDEELAALGAYLARPRP